METFRFSKIRKKAQMFEACVPVEWFEWFECALCGRCGWGGCNSCPPPLPSPPPTRLTIEADVPVLQLFSLFRPEGPRSPRGDKGSALTLCMPPPPGRPPWPPGEQWGGGGVLVDILSCGILKYQTLENYQALLRWIFQTSKILGEIATHSFKVKYQNRSSSKKKCFPTWTRQNELSQGAHNIWIKVSSSQVRYPWLHLNSSFKSYLRTMLKPKTPI